MAKTVKVEIRYHEAKDTLYLRILPKRPARMTETDYDFYVRYDRDDQTKIVGFEWLDFSTYFNAIDEPGVIPELDMTFNVVGTNLQGLKVEGSPSLGLSEICTQTRSPHLHSFPTTRCRSGLNAVREKDRTC